MMTSLSGMLEKLRMMFEAATAHSCFSARPSSSKLNRPSSSKLQAPGRSLLAHFRTDDSLLEDPDPVLWLKDKWTKVTQGN